jgi:hypothetical protein
LKGLPGAGALRKTLLLEDSLAACIDILESARESLRGWLPPFEAMPPAELSIPGQLRAF